LRFARILLFALIINTFTLSGCLVQSIDPYYTDGSITDIPALKGQWTLVEEQGKKLQPVKAWVFEGDKIITYAERVSEGVLRAKCFKVGDSLFMDTYPDDPDEKANKWWVMHVFPIHVLTKIELQDDHLTLTPINESWMQDALKNGTLALPHIRQKGENSVLFTASPEQWMEFLKKYAANKSVFDEKNSLRFLRQKAE
jgi:hypothetical protein